MKDSNGKEFLDPNDIMIISKGKARYPTEKGKYGFPCYEDKGIRYYKCHYCKTTIFESKLTRDHKIPKSKGGPGTIKNLVPCCRECNQLKGDMDYNDFVFHINNKPIWDEPWYKALCHQLPIDLREKIVAKHNQGLKITYKSELNEEGVTNTWTW